MPIWIRLPLNIAWLTRQCCAVMSAKPQGVRALIANLTASGNFAREIFVLENLRVFAIVTTDFRVNY